jgi:hypothetical protein
MVVLTEKGKIQCKKETRFERNVKRGSPHKTFDFFEAAELLSGASGEK